MATAPPLTISISLNSLRVGMAYFFSIPGFVHQKLVQAFSANVEFIRSPSGNNPIIAIESHLIGLTFQLTPESIAKFLGVTRYGPSNENAPHHIPPFRDVVLPI